MMKGRSMDMSQFKFKTQVRVRNYEVDWQGIVHNANYLLYFEVGRIEYLKQLRVKIDINTIQNASKVVLVRNEVNYRSPARFDDLLDVHTRISYIKETSFVFEGIIESVTSKSIIADNTAIHVWLRPGSREPMRVPDSFRQTVREFEGSSLQIVDARSKS